MRARGMRCWSWLVCLAACGSGGSSLDVVGEDAAIEAESSVVMDAGAEASVAMGPPWLRDEQGGVLVLRGANVAGEAKSRSDHLPASFTVEDFRRMRDELGLNAVRLLVFWEAIEPQRGVYDETYLRAVRTLVDQLGAERMHVLVDMHQDVYGRGFGHGGAPRWTCDEALYAQFQPPMDWFQGYFTQPVQTCFDRFWAAGAVRDAFASAWARLARTLRGAPGVVAFDLCNEPSWGSASYTDWDLRMGPEAYTQIIDAIRREDPTVRIALEPASIANVGMSSRFAPPSRTQLVYAPHMYPPALELGQGYPGDPMLPQGFVRTIRRDATRMNLPFFVGEFGVRGNVPRAADYLRDAYDVLDANGVSAFQWEAGKGDAYSFWNAQGVWNDLARAMVRPAPRRIAGVPVQWRWVRSTSTFTATWNEDGSARGESEFAAPSLLFPMGVQATMQDGGMVRVDGTRVLVAQRGGIRTLTVRAQR